MPPFPLQLIRLVAKQYNFATNPHDLRKYSTEYTMTALLIKDVPPALHTRLRQDAQKHHRSMTRHALAILESSLEPGHIRVSDLPPPLKSKQKLTTAWLDRAKRAGRA